MTAKPVPKYIIEKVAAATRAALKAESLLHDVEEWIAVNYGAEVAKNWKLTSGAETLYPWFEPPDAESLTVVAESVACRKQLKEMHPDVE